jgi:hypothetical protein
VLYALALLAKEDAVIGVALLALIWWFRDRRRDVLPDVRVLVYFGAVTIAYLVVRTLVIDHVTQDNWGPGLHALRNLAGGFLYQVYRGRLRAWSASSTRSMCRHIRSGPRYSRFPCWRCFSSRDGCSAGAGRCDSAWRGCS